MVPILFVKLKTLLNFRNGELGRQDCLCLIKSSWVLTHVA